MDYSITAGSSLHTKRVDVKKSDTPKTVLKDLGVSLNNAQIMLDGRVLATNELDHSLESLGCSDNSFLTVSTKQNSGNLEA